jgi:dTDP-L-rhamnose 4-epimerase
MQILITGGAGFIGSHLADELLHAGHRVRALDLLVPQVHGKGAGRPAYLHPEVELIRGDVRDAEAVGAALLSYMLWPTPTCCRRCHRHPSSGWSSPPA